MLKRFGLAAGAVAAVAAVLVLVNHSSIRLGPAADLQADRMGREAGLQREWQAYATSSIAEPLARPL